MKTLEELKHDLDQSRLSLPSPNSARDSGNQSGSASRKSAYTEWWEAECAGIANLISAYPKRPTQALARMDEHPPSNRPANPVSRIFYDSAKGLVPVYSTRRATCDNHLGAVGE